MTLSNRLFSAAVLVPAAFLMFAACSDDESAGGLPLVIGDIEGPIGTFCASPGATTFPGANSIDLGTGLGATAADTFRNLVDVDGHVTTVAFAFDGGGQGFGVVFCGRGGNAQEDDGVSANGPVLHKPWHLEGLTPGGRYTMTFTAGGRGTPRRSGRIFVDADGDGTIEAGEVADLIGLDGVVETRTFPQTITAGPTGQIRGEWWGGSTNDVGENGAFEGGPSSARRNL
jgi:hypothetical protein